MTSELLFATPASPPEETPDGDFGVAAMCAAVPAAAGGMFFAVPVPPAAGGMFFAVPVPPAAGEVPPDVRLLFDAPACGTLPDAGAFFAIPVPPVACCGLPTPGLVDLPISGAVRGRFPGVMSAGDVLFAGALPPVACCGVPVPGLVGLPVPGAVRGRFPDVGSAGGAGFAVAAGLLPCVAAGAGVGVGVPGLCGASAWLAGILPGAGVGCGVPGLCGASAWLAGILPGAGVGVGFGVPGLPMPPADVVLSCGVVLAEVPPGLAACAPAEDPAAGPEKLGEPADGETAADAGADGVAGRVVTVLREPRPGVTVLCSVLPVSPA